MSPICARSRKTQPSLAFFSSARADHRMRLLIFVGGVFCFCFGTTHGSTPVLESKNHSWWCSGTLYDDLTQVYRVQGNPANAMTPTLDGVVWAAWSSQPTHCPYPQVPQTRLLDLTLSPLEPPSSMHKHALVMKIFSNQPALPMTSAYFSGRGCSKFTSLCSPNLPVHTAPKS